jgi:hypothetical protein
MHYGYYLLRSLNDSRSFRIASENRDDIDRFFYGFLSLFPGLLDYEQKKILTLTRKVSEVEANVTAFVQQHGDKIKELHNILAFIRKLKDGDN